MLCYIILYYIILYYIMLCYVMLCYIILYYTILYLHKSRTFVPTDYPFCSFGSFRFVFVATDFFFNILFCRFDEFLERTQIEEEKSPLSFIFSMSQKRKADVLPADKVGRNNTTTNFCCCLFVYSYGYSNIYFSRKYQA